MTRKHPLGFCAAIVVSTAFGRAAEPATIVVFDPPGSGGTYPFDINDQGTFRKRPGPTGSMTRERPRDTTGSMAGFGVSSGRRAEKSGRFRRKVGEAIHTLSGSTGSG